MTVVVPRLWPFVAGARVSRCAKAGVLDRVFEQIQRAQILRIRLAVVALDSTMVKVHPDSVCGLVATCWL